MEPFCKAKNLFGKNLLLLFFILMHSFNNKLNGNYISRPPVRVERALASLNHKTISKPCSCPYTFNHNWWIISTQDPADRASGWAINHQPQLWIANFRNSISVAVAMPLFCYQQQQHQQTCSNGNRYYVTLFFFILFFFVSVVGRSKCSRSRFNKINTTISSGKKRFY